MQASFICLALLSAYHGELVLNHVNEHFTGVNYRVKWKSMRPFPPGAAVEVGNGDGHGGTLGWLRLRPGKNGVDVLSVQFDEGFHPYDSKWPPDRAPVTVKHARMGPGTYAALLRDLAIVDAARITSARRESFLSSRDFWVSARVATNGKTFMDEDWAGYWSATSEVASARPHAAASLTREAVKKLKFTDHKLTKEERAWASAKFARDWKWFNKHREPYWWVRERYIIVVGVTGDASVLPTLRDVLGGDPKDRCVYHAINAVTRLTGKDVRSKPVKEMDVKAIRPKVLDLIKDRK